MPEQNPPGETQSGEVRVALGSIYGTRDAPRAWYLHLKAAFAQHGLREIGIEKGLYCLPGKDGPAMLVSTHVDDLAVALRAADANAAGILHQLSQELHLREEVVPTTYCGKRVEVTPEAVYLSQPKAVSALELVQVQPARKQEADSPLQPQEQTLYRSVVGQLEQTLYRSVVGQLLWLATQTRPDLGFAVSRAAQWFAQATVADLLQLNSLIKQAQQHSAAKLTFRRNLFGFSEDSAFANAQGLKSQYGVVVVVTTDPRSYIAGQYSVGMMWTWASATIKRVVRSTLAAEAYAISEAAEFGHLLRQLLQQVHHPELTLKQLEAAAPTGALLVVTDSQNLATNVPKDTSAVTDKRLRIVITMLRETFLDPQQRTQLLWKPTGLMLADGLTKAVKADALLAATDSSVSATSANLRNRYGFGAVSVSAPHRRADIAVPVVR
ncbi:unnamed protein product, partial [Polarella glacialis]